jgi:hypothetical protein
VASAGVLTSDGANTIENIPVIPINKKSVDLFKGTKVGINPYINREYK